MNSTPKVYPDTQPARGEIIVRGVCGALLGLGVAALIWLRCGGCGVCWLRCGGGGAWGSAALFAVSVIVCTFGSIRHGDAFWFAVLRRSR